MDDHTPALCQVCRSRAANVCIPFGPVSIYHLCDKCEPDFLSGKPVRRLRG